MATGSRFHLIGIVNYTGELLQVMGIVFDISKTQRLSMIVLISLLGSMTVLWLIGFDIGGCNYDGMACYKPLSLILPFLLSLPLAYHLAYLRPNSSKSLALTFLIVCPLVGFQLFTGILSNCSGLGSVECPYSSTLNIAN